MRYFLVGITALFLWATTGTTTSTALGWGSNFQGVYKYNIKRNKKVFVRVKRVRSKSVSASVSCLKPQTHALWLRVKARFPDATAISTCRAGAIIAGTNRPSFHRYGMAVDFNTRNKAGAISFLRSQGVFVMTYCDSGHIHFNHGQTGYVGCGTKYRGKRSFVKAFKANKATFFGMPIGGVQ